MAVADTAALGIPRERWIQVTELPPLPSLYDGFSPSSRRFERFVQRRDHFRHLQPLARALEIPQGRLLEATEDQPFRHDFGRDRHGRIVIFFLEGLRRWALGGGHRQRARRGGQLKAVA